MPDQPFVEIEQRLFTASVSRMRVYGIRRCGQHAIINWILRNSGRADTVFLNSCTMKRSAVRTCGQSELDGVFSGKSHRLMRALEGYLTPEKRPFVLISYEAGYHQGGITPEFDDQGFDHEVLITRSFVNWLPSFIRLMRLINRPAGDEMLDISNGVIFEISRYKAHLKAAKTSTAVVICFDKWVKLPEYRSLMLAKLGLNVVDNSLGKVQSYGRGSSFSGLEQPAEAMPLSARWKTMIDDPYAKMFLQLALADAEFIDLLAGAYPEDMDIIQNLLAGGENAAKP